MTTNKRTKRKQTKSERTAGKKMPWMRKVVKKRLAEKMVAPNKKKLAKKKAAPKKATVKTKDAEKTAGRKTAGALKRQIRRKSQSVDTVAFAPGGPESRSGVQSGDLQGLSNVEGADSESVGELIEEGNTFEADVVKGVEDAEDTDESEVHTHETPEDDIPREYLDKE
jgi:cobalamin biosynthesis protein CobT